MSTGVVDGKSNRANVSVYFCFDHLFASSRLEAVESAYRGIDDQHSNKRQRFASSTPPYLVQGIERCSICWRNRGTGLAALPTGFKVPVSEQSQESGKRPLLACFK